jgi:hypothetical protein
MNNFFMEMIRKTIQSIQKRGFFGVLRAAIADFFEVTSRHLAHIRDYGSKYTFIDRRLNKPTLVVILAGYKSYLWSATLARLEKHAPPDADLCIASAGTYSKELADFCARAGWSYLSVKRNAPGVALNRAIALHPSADFIYKIDEDIFVGQKFFQLLHAGYEHAWRDSFLEPGFCAPVLNVNGISYRAFLRELGHESEYQREFGELIIRCSELPVHNDPKASWWLWQRTLPFDEKSERFSNLLGRYSICSTRFSIGAILFRRSFIEKVGGFKSSWHSGVLGVDEDMLCRDCISKSRPMYIIESALAGHFSFYPQEIFMRERLADMARLDPATFPPEHFCTSTNRPT